MCIDEYSTPAEIRAEEERREYKKTYWGNLKDWTLVIDEFSTPAERG